MEEMLGVVSKDDDAVQTGRLERQLHNNAVKYTLLSLVDEEQKMPFVVRPTTACPSRPASRRSSTIIAYGGPRTNAKEGRRQHSGSAELKVPESEIVHMFKEDGQVMEKAADPSPRSTHRKGWRLTSLEETQ